LPNALILASELTQRTLWYPTILGVLVPISAVALFCGTVYLLLATNLGARLGFLVIGAGLAGLMILLSLLWMTTASPRNTLKGRSAQWVALESISGGDLARSKYEPVQTAKTPANKVDLAELANVKAAVDAALVAPTETGAISEETGATSKFAIYSAATDYIVKSAYETGGGSTFSQVDVSTGAGWPWIHMSLHEPLYAVAFICPVDKDAQIVPFGDPIPAPKCDTSKPVDALVYVRDLGSMRVPPTVAFLGSGTLFVLFLLGLHWRERDLQAQAAALTEAAERVARDAADDKTPETV